MTTKRSIDNKPMVHKEWPTRKDWNDTNKDSKRETKKTGD